MYIAIGVHTDRRNKGCLAVDFLDCRTPDEAKQIQGEGLVGNIMVINVGMPDDVAIKKLVQAVNIVEGRGCISDGFQEWIGRSVETALVAAANNPGILKAAQKSK